MESFYREVKIGTSGELVYEPLKVAITDDGKVFLEADPDVYGKIRKPLDEVIDRINNLHVAAEVDWTKIRSIVQEHSGIAEDVTLFPIPLPR
jgi:L,D-transpeptidase ErfK/SrfK